jgi:hypothetical protein
MDNGAYCLKPGISLGEPLPGGNSSQYYVTIDHFSSFGA